MALEVVGTGFGRTGTLSLKLALEQLGFGPCYHMIEVAQNPGHSALWSAAWDRAPTDWDALFAGYRATVDWPSTAFWRQIADHFPNARVIHTERPSAAWYKSASSTIVRVMRSGAATSATAAMYEQLEMARKLILRGVFDDRFDSEEHAIAIYEAHNARVRREIAPERLLVYQPGEGWGPLCKFLGVPVPETPYPKVNTTDDFLARLRP
jgi:Sulfotransferase domain